MKGVKEAQLAQLGLLEEQDQEDFVDQQDLLVSLDLRDPKA